MKLYHPYLILLFSVLFFNDTKAQYTVGFPVDEQISTNSYYSYGNCSPSYDVSISFPVSPITGVTNVLIFTDIVQTNPVFVNLTDEINVGDSLFFTDQSNSFKFYSVSPWDISYEIKAIGTPLIANESYNCGAGLWFDGLTDCSNFLMFQYDENLCSVSGSSQTDTGETEKETFYNFSEPPLASLFENQMDSPLFFFNTTTKLLTIKNINPDIITSLTMFNTLGEQVFKKSNFKIDAQILIPALTSGIYFIETGVENNIFRNKIIIE